MEFPILWLNILVFILVLEDDYIWRHNQNKKKSNLIFVPPYPNMDKLNTLRG